MKRPVPATGSAGLLAACLCGLALAGCASANDDLPAEPRQLSLSERKLRMLLDTEYEILLVLKEAKVKLATLAAEFQASVARARVAFRLNTSDPVLADFGAADQAARRAEIEQQGEVTKVKLEQLISQFENAIWLVATQAGQRERGAEVGSRTGYFLLDDKVETSLLQLARYADVERLKQAEMLGIYDDVVLERELRHELPGIGVLSLYKSAPTLGLFAPGQEGQAVVAALVREEGATAVPYSWVQAERMRVELAGMVESVSPWQLDPATPNGDGVLALRSEVASKTRLASDVIVPAVDTDDPSFQALRDHVVLREYRTALRRDDNGALVAIIGWQVAWNVDFRGFMRVLVNREDFVLPDDPVLPELLAARASGQ